MRRIAFLFCLLFLLPACSQNSAGTAPSSPYRQNSRVTASQFLKADQFVLALVALMQKTDKFDYRESRDNRGTVAPMILGIALHEAGIDKEELNVKQLLLIEHSMFDENYEAKKIDVVQANKLREEVLVAHSN